MSYFDEEFDEIIETNAEMARLVIDSSFVSTEKLNKSIKYLDKLRLRGEEPPILLDHLKEKKFLTDTQYTALRKAYLRFINDKEKSQFSIQGYQIIKKIVSGGLGIVFSAKQLSMKRSIAIKILHANWADDEEFRTRFLREARVMGRLSHQNLIQVFDVGKESKNYYFSMEYIDGPTIEDKIRTEGSLAVEEALEITIQVARAIKYIAGYDIVHRDIKPANLMITQTGVVKLGDFGFLYMRNKKELKQKGYVIGTPDYISPEQASGDDIDFRSDIYSLGVCLYQMLSGVLPYSGTVSTVMLQHVSGDLPERTSMGSESIPSDIYNIICKLMAKDPNDRYQDIDLLLDDLQYYKAAEVMKKRPLPLLQKNAFVAEEIEPHSTPSPEQDLSLEKQNKLLFKALIFSFILLSAETFFLLFKL